MKEKNYKISNVQQDDVSTLYDLQNKYIAHPYCKEEFVMDITTTRHHYFVCKKDSNILGFVSFVDNIDSVDILQIVVDEKYRRANVATQLMDNVKSYCISHNIKNIFLEVRQDNDAKYFYEKYGFALINVRKKYYGDQDALIYQLKL